MKKSSVQFLVLFLAFLFVSFQSYAQEGRGERREERRGDQNTSTDIDFGYTDIGDRGEPLPSYPGSYQPSYPAPSYPSPSYPSPSYPTPGYSYPSPSYDPYPQQPSRLERRVQPHSTLSLIVNQSVRGYTELSLKRLIKEQLGQNISGAEILRLTVEGQPLAYGPATVQLEINHRPVAIAKPLGRGGRAILQVQYPEAVESNLRLIVSGDAQIRNIIISVGEVRGRHEPGPSFPTRLVVNRSIGAYSQLELSQLLPYEYRLVRSLTIEARSQHSAQVQLMARGLQVGTAYVSQYGGRQLIFLSRPMSLHELSLQAHLPVLIETLELEFEGQYR